jgi:class 3 adenylate cyclase
MQTRGVAGLPSGTITLLFSDIEGSTRLLRRLGPAYEALLGEHRSLLRGAFTEAGGAEVETRGDSFLVAFQSAHEAVKGAVAAQRALAAQTWPANVEVRVRMGMHTGEPTLAAEGYVGLDVHRAARIGEAASGGQVLVSEATRAVIGDDVVLRDLGEYQLAGLERPERLYQVVAPGLASEFGPLRAQPPSRPQRDPWRASRELEQVGWRVNGLRGVAPAAFSRPLEALAGRVLAAARLVADTDRTLVAADRDDLAGRVADYEARASVAPHVAQAGAELAQQLVALDRLPERRRALEEQISRLEDELGPLELRLQSSPRSSASHALLEELEDWRGRLVSVTQLLEQTLAAAPRAPELPPGPLRRTRRRGIFRAGSKYVVLEADEQGAKYPRVVASLVEALQLREHLRAARRFGSKHGDPHTQDHHDRSSPWVG